MAQNTDVGSLLVPPHKVIPGENVVLNNRPKESSHFNWSIDVSESFRIREMNSPVVNAR